MKSNRLLTAVCLTLVLFATIAFAAPTSGNVVGANPMQNVTMGNLNPLTAPAAVVANGKTNQFVALANNKALNQKVTGFVEVNVALNNAANTQIANNGAKQVTRTKKVKEWKISTNANVFGVASGAVRATNSNASKTTLKTLITKSWTANTEVMNL